MGTIQLGLCQMKVTADKAENLRTAEEAIRTAARQGFPGTILQLHS